MLVTVIVDHNKYGDFEKLQFFLHQMHIAQLIKHMHQTCMVTNTKFFDTCLSSKMSQNLSSKNTAKDLKWLTCSYEHATLDNLVI